MLGVTPALRSLGVIRSDEATLSPGLRTAGLLQPRAWVGYWWQHTRLCPLCHNSRLLDFVSHELPIRDRVGDIPPDAPQNDFFLEMTSLKVHRPSPSTTSLLVEENSGLFSQRKTCDKAELPKMLL